MTKVKFYLEKDSVNEVFAFFTNEKYNSIENGVFMSYSHLGQHSGCHIDYVKECKEAAPNQYAELLDELAMIGYDDLFIMNSEGVIKCDYEFWRNHTESEIKFGEGAIHYRTFTLFEIGYNKKGELKKWIIADDGLRYNRF